MWWVTLSLALVPPPDPGLGAVLLAEASGTPTPCPPGLLFAAAANGARRAAVAQELLDRRELAYVLTDRRCFADDLDMLRRRREELHDAPPLAERFRFPGRDACAEAVRFNREVRWYLNQRLELEPWHGDGLRRLLRETDRHYRCWDALRDAASDCYYAPVRRRGLKALRGMLTPAAWAAGAMPGAAPAGAFTELR